MAVSTATAAVAVALGTASVAGGDPYPLCNRDSACGTGWYTSPVTVSWELNGASNDGGCGTQNYSPGTQ